MTEAGPARDFSLPWGSWLTLGEDGFIHDEEGNRWRSVRQALMQGRLRIPSTRDDYDLFTAFLLSFDGAPYSPFVDTLDLFQGNWEYRGFYRDWLQGHELIEHVPQESAYRLTPEGRSVLLMLAATRGFEDGPIPVGEDSVAAGPAGDGRAEREAWFAEIDALAERMPSRFVRRDVGGRPMIVATAEAMGGRIKLRRTLWTQPFGSAESRDLFYRWLAMRIHRWPDWVGDAWRGGQQGLTARLLSLLAADLVDHAARLGLPASFEGGR